MTRKDYTLLVNVLAKAFDDGRVLHHLKNALKNDNPKFNEKKFEDYLDIAIRNREGV